MRNIRTYTFLILALTTCCLRSQTEFQKLVDVFNKSDLKTKVRLLADQPDSKIAALYPFIKDSLETIRARIREKSNSPEAKFKLDLIDAKLAYAQQNYSRSIFLLKHSLQTNQVSFNDSLRCYSLLKNSYLKTTNYIRALEMNARMEKMWPRKSDSIQIDFGAKKSTIYALLQFIPEAIQERRKEFRINYDSKDTNALISFYNDIGVYHNRIKNSDSAEFYFLKAKGVLSQKKIPETKKVFYDFFDALIGGNLGLSYFNKGETKKAIPLLIDDIYFSKKHGDMASAFNSHNLLVECYLKTGEKELARKHLDSAEKLMPSFFGDIAQRTKLLLTRALFYRSTDDHKKGLSALSDYLNLKDSLSNIEKEQNLLNTEITFKVEQREYELQEKNRILEAKKLEEAKQKTFKAYLLAGIIFLVGLVVFLIMVNYLSKRRELDLYEKNEQIKAQHTQIQQSLNEKEMLIKEIHHRVKNNLQIITSMLSLQMSKVSEKEAADTLREARQRISSIALTHQMLYQNSTLKEIVINEYISNLVSLIKSGLPETGINVLTHFDHQNNKMIIDTAIPLGLLINELLTNAFKHGFPGNTNGTINVILKEDPGHCLIAIEDNGVGMPGPEILERNRSMGMDLIEILSEQLNAVLKFESVNGTRVSITIPSEKIYI